jgi:hypothetical protein
MTGMKPHEAMDIAVCMLLDAEDLRAAEYPMDKRIELVKRFYGRLMGWKTISDRRKPPKMEYYNRAASACGKPDQTTIKQTEE